MARSNRQVIRDLEKQSKGAPRRPRFLFIKILLLCVFVLLIAIGVGMHYLGEYLKSYEDSRLDNIIRTLQENIDYNFWESSARNVIASRLTEFETNGTDPLARHISRIRDVRYVLRQRSEQSTPEAPVYTMRAGARDIGIIRFKATESAGYGFYLWAVDSIEFLDSFVDDMCFDVSITASQNAQVKINGVSVSQEYRTQCDDEYGASYFISGLYGEVDVSVVEIDGKKSNPYYAEDGEYFFPINIPFSRSYDYTIPDSATLLIDGIPAPPESITVAGIIPDAFIGIIEPEQIPVKYDRYQIELKDIYFEPVVSIDYPGGTLVQRELADGGLFFTEDYSLDYKEQYASLVEEFIRAYVSYGANIGNNPDTNIARINKYLLKNTDLYQRIQSGKSAMMWINGVTVSYNSLEIDLFMPYGDNYFTCEASYNITNKTHYETKELNGRFELLYYLSDGKWYVISMAILQDDS